ncbi:hypothetical protein IQ260_28795 [Leptolyngbya cf. ectocarpi LEGE 11479]|uniref:ZIP Zinc transporter n=1 Tax=Leptolyngbya cf. ectocarpi LEGE 11479 TaxID=1828722 RepID=A0A929FDI8_LEPEC|nr:hypothetical protein [Leptolyngbya ectocarpi]MBE9070643.1 hypothetical protein [Leptolyngbya cf. ectocarpi LEGE 11479]
MGIGINIVGLALATCLGLVHIFASRTQWLTKIPQRWWISIAGGVSIAYIFLDILPELSHAQAEIQHSRIGMIRYLEHHVYLLALLGLALFYGLEKLALRSRSHQHENHGKDYTHPGIFWIHVISFGMYNGILGYLLRESENHGLIACLILFFALALHFVVNDVGLREHHKHMYDRIGRWLLAGAIVLGWAVGEAFHLDEAAIAAIWALVAGGIILNVLKEEFPEEQESHFGMFFAGAALYSVVLLAI